MIREAVPVLIIAHKNEEMAFELPEDRPVFIGRDVKCEIRLADNEVSRTHAVIIHKNGLSAIKDLNSFSGTFLNGKPVTQPAAMNSGDSITIGSYKIRLLKLRSLTSNTRIEPPKSRSTTQILAKGHDPAARSDTSIRAENQKSADDMRELMDAIEPQTKRADLRGSDTQMFMAVDAKPAKPAANADSGTDTNFIEPNSLLEEHAFDNLPTSSPSTTDSEETSEIGATTTGFRESGTWLVPMPGQPPPEDRDADESGSMSTLHDETDSQSLDELVGSDDEDDDDGEQGDDDLELDGETPPTIEDELDIQPEEMEPVPLDPALREAIEARLKMYSLLSNLAEERRFFRTQGNLPEDVLMELGRQDREFYTLPPVEEVDKLLKERQQALGVTGEFDGGATEDESDRPTDKEKTKLRQAEEIALSQLMLISKYNSQVLPVVYRRAYSLAIEEPLSKDLRLAKISHVGLIGGACYCLALERMLEECKSERNALKARMKAIQDGKTDGKTSIGGFFDKLTKNFAASKGDKAELARLNQNELQLANTAIYIGREIAFVEKSLIAEFWRVYRAAVKFFIPQANSMPYSVRAFLRYGVIAFSPWWLSPRLAQRIRAECSDDIVMEYTGRIGSETILHADEYLAAVWKMECAPIPNETLMMREKNSLRWKAERAYRRMLNGRQRMVVLREVLQQLADQDLPLEMRLSEVDGQILELASTQRDGGGQTSSLQRERHNLEEKRDALARRGKYIENRYLKATREIVGEAEERFQSGELVQPAAAEVLDHECELLIETSRRLAGNRERFLPLFIRKHFMLDSDVVVNRDSIERFLLTAEEKDPALFRVKLIDSSRKENRLQVDLKPIFIIIPSSGVITNCLIGRDGLENGRLALPTLFFRENLREKQFMNLMADYRWECARALSGRDPMSSDTVTGAFMRVRWEWRRFPKAKRQKGLIFKELSDKVNWRRVYEMYMQDAQDGGRKLFSRNYECYARIFVKYFDPPDGVEFLKKKN